jgi:hypothetical protein
MLGGVILLTKCDPTDIESASAAGRLDHMIMEPLPAEPGAKDSTNFDRCSIGMLQQRRAGVKAHRRQGDFGVRNRGSDGGRSYRPRVSNWSRRRITSPPHVAFLPAFLGASKARRTLSQCQPLLGRSRIEGMAHRGRLCPSDHCALPQRRASVSSSPVLGPELQTAHLVSRQDA